MSKLKERPETSRSQIENTIKEDLEEGEYEHESSSEESGQGYRSSRVASSSDDGETNKKEESIRRSPRVRNNKHLRQDYVY